LQTGRISGRKKLKIVKGTITYGKKNVSSFAQPQREGKQRSVGTDVFQDKKQRKHNGGCKGEKKGDTWKTKSVVKKVKSGRKPMEKKYMG